MNCAIQQTRKQLFLWKSTRSPRYFPQALLPQEIFQSYDEFDFSYLSTEFCSIFDEIHFVSFNLFPTCFKIILSFDSVFNYIKIICKFNPLYYFIQAILLININWFILINSRPWGISLVTPLQKDEELLMSTLWVQSVNQLQ